MVPESDRETIPGVSVRSTTCLPVVSSQRRKGSVLPELSEKADLDMSSRRASEATMKVLGCVAKRSRRGIRDMTRGLMSLGRKELVEG